MSNIVVAQAMLVIAKRIDIDENDCWNWTGALTSGGYGQLTFQGKHQTAHRFSYKQLIGQIDDGMWILHRCDNRRCVNPTHLYQGTPVNNRADMLNRKRWSHPWGERTHCSNGHEYELVGFRVDKNDGSRVCRECQRNYKREQRAAKAGV